MNRSAQLHRIKTGDYGQDEGRLLADVAKYYRDNKAAIDAEWDALEGRTAQARAIDDINARSPEWKAQASKEWNEL